jgi:predicted nucleic acid-binding protein
MVFVDTNILLDVVIPNPDWVNWSASHLLQLARIHDLVINPIVYAELSVSFSSIAKVEASIADLDLKLHDMPREVAFLAGKAFARYRRNGGTRTSVLPDFFIGAHASVLTASLLTRDPQRFKTYFPTVHLITP